MGIFLFALIVHLIGLNLIGRTWDEQYKVDFGVQGIDRIIAADYSLQGWSEGTEHPMVGKYIYGFFAQMQMTYIRGLTDIAPLSPEEVSNIKNGNYVITAIYDKMYAVPYDFTTARVGSALFNAFAVLFTVILAFYLIKNIWWSVLSGVLLLLTERFVFLGQLVTFESLSIFLFCLIVFYFNKLLKNPTNSKQYILVGMLSGLFFWTRYNNIIVFPFLVGWVGLHYFFTKDKKIVTFKLLIIPTVAFLLGIIIWPYLWYNFPQSLFDSLHFHQKRLELSNILYYWNYVLVTTPIPLLFGAAIGIGWGIYKRKYWHMIFLWWILCTLLVYSVFVIPIGGTRLVSIIYPVLSIFAAYGYFKMLRKKFVLLLIPILLWLVIDEVRIYPYYLDYYNQFVGGVSGARQKGYDFSWWGEGQREVGLWVNENVSNGESVGLIVDPKYVFPAIRPGIVKKDYVDATTDADYVAISYYDEIRLPKKFFRTHKLVYQATVEGERLVGLYKRSP